jgi:hypothetical protein
LAEVVVQVGDIVGEDEAEGEGLALEEPGVREAAGIGVLDGVGEVAVEGEEESEDLGPGKEIVALEADPVILPVAGEGELGVDLEADEALEIVVARVDEMADGLLGAPLAGGEGLGGGFGGEGG